MAMLIGKFHKLIQSKTVWYIILGLIVIAFVGLYIKWPEQEAQADEANAAGKLNGTWISQQEFRDAYMNTYLSLVMAVGRAPQLDEELSRELRDSAWRRLASLKEAEKLGLAATDNEVVNAIRNHPGFMTEGQYNPRAFQAFVQSLGQGMGVTQAGFEEHIRQEITLQKLRYILIKNIVISPFEQMRSYHTIADSFDIEYAPITFASVEKDVEVTDEDIRQFFESNPEQYTIPPKVSVKYVTFSSTDYTNDIEVSEDDALLYYDEFIDNYTDEVMTTTQVINVDATGTNDMYMDQESLETVITPFDDVEPEIRSILSDQVALNRATDAATGFVIDLTPSRSGESPEFETVVMDYGLTVYTTAPFSAAGEVDGIEMAAMPAFLASAFALTPAVDEYFSDAIPGTGTVYVLALNETYESYVPELEEVRDAVEEDARINAIQNLMIERGNEFREAAIEDLETTNTIAYTADKFGYPVEVVTNISAISASITNGYNELLLRSAITHNEGEVTDMLPYEDGSLVAYIKRRMVADNASFRGFQPQLIDSIREGRAARIFREWQEQLLKDGDFVDRQRQAEEALEEELAAEATEEQPPEDEM